MRDCEFPRPIRLGEDRLPFNERRAARTGDDKAVDILRQAIARVISEPGLRDERFVDAPILLSSTIPLKSFINPLSQGKDEEGRTGSTPASAILSLASWMILSNEMNIDCRLQHIIHAPNDRLFFLLQGRGVLYSVNSVKVVIDVRDGDIRISCIIYQGGNEGAHGYDVVDGFCVAEGGLAATALI